MGSVRKTLTTARLILGGALLVSFAVSAAAQSPPGSTSSGPAAAQQDAFGAPAGRQVLQPGVYELMFEGSFVGISSGGETESSVRVDAMLGYFVTPNLEIGAIAGVLKPPGYDAIGSLGGLFAFNIPNDSPVVPFVGTAAGSGLSYGSDIGDPFWITIFGGFKLLMPGGGGALVVRPFYEHQFFSSDSPLEDIDLFGVSIGASLFF